LFKGTPRAAPDTSRHGDAHRVVYSTRPRGFYGGTPEDVDDIEATLERLDGHGVAIADSMHPRSVLNRLFD
jgi:hypothetical protein